MKEIKRTRKRHQSKQENPRKLYVALKPCKEPHVICKLDCRPFVDLTEESGIHYQEDEKGYYILHGELELDAN